MAVRISGLLLGCLVSLQACNGAEQPTGETKPAAEPTETELPAEPAPAAETQSVEPVVTDTETVRQADSHVHGDASLAIVLEGSLLTIELDTPLFNIAGFEHAPETDEQVAAIEQAEALLKQPETLFQMSEAASCAPADNDLDVHLAEGDHDEHDHEDGDHEEGEHDDHDEEDGHDDDHSEHKDVVITYSFECQNPAELKEVSTSLLSQFPNMTDVEVVYLGPDSQKVFSLTPTNSRVNLSE